MHIKLPSVFGNGKILRDMVWAHPSTVDPSTKLTYPTATNTISAASINVQQPKRWRAWVANEPGYLAASSLASPISSAAQLGSRIITNPAIHHHAHSHFFLRPTQSRGCTTLRSPNPPRSPRSQASGLLSPPLALLGRPTNASKTLSKPVVASLNMLDPTWLAAWECASRIRR